LKSFKRRKKSQDSVVEFLEEDEGLGSDSVHAPPDVRVRAAVANVTVGDADALECGVCFLALMRPPIFQVHIYCNLLYMSG
jgi:E3 ubiquitin-protein ligase SIAH1